MTSSIKQFSLLFLEEITKANNILLTLHPQPDPDSACSNLAMYHLLKNMGKNVTVISGDSELSPSLNLLPGYYQIEATNIFNLDLNKFDLFIILDISDKRRISEKGIINFPPTLRTMVIDHHANEGEYASIAYSDSLSAATCLVLYDLYKELNIEYTPDISLCLLIGIYSDTVGFKYFPDSQKIADTFSKISELLKIDNRYTQVVNSLENNYSSQNLSYLALAINSIQHFFRNSVAISSIEFNQLQSLNITSHHIGDMNFSTLLKSVIGNEIAITLIEYQEDIVIISLRTRDNHKFDLSKLAKALGGGGHSYAAGATLNISFSEAKTLLLNTISKIYPELGEP